MLLFPIYRQVSRALSDQATNPRSVCSEGQSQLDTALSLFPRTPLEDQEERRMSVYRPLHTQDSVEGAPLKLSKFPPFAKHLVNFLPFR